MNRGMTHGFRYNVQPVGDSVALDITVSGAPIHLDIQLTRNRMTLADIVPLAYQICDTITRVSLDTLANRQAVPCKKGCSACCSRCLVPISPAEAFYLRQCVLNAPQSRRRQMQMALLGAARKILESTGPNLFDHPVEALDTADSEELLAVSQWYEGLKIACPLLQFGCCSIYDQRPLACRQYFICGSAEGCRGREGVAEPVPLAVSMVDVLTRLSAELEDDTPEAVVLPLVLAWTTMHSGRNRRAWPARTVVTTLVRILKKAAEKTEYPAAMAS